MTPSRVMVIGKMTSGKTTVADHLVDNFGFKKLTLAKALKDMIVAIEAGDGAQKIVTEHVMNHVYLSAIERERMVTAIEKTMTLPHETPKPRKRLQYLGTEGGRQTVRDTIWIDIIKGQVKPKEKYVIDDVRFLNEYQAFYAINFVPIQVRITDETQKTRIIRLYGEFDPNILKHPSETEQAKITIDPKYSINNDGPIDHLYYYVEKILNLTS
jgi:dephospho-CoA kinase